MPYTPLPQSTLESTRETMCKFIIEEVISSKGEFYYTGARR